MGIFKARCRLQRKCGKGRCYGISLLINAGKYTLLGGRIALTLEGSADQVVYRVSDNGIGIDSELLPRIFDLFSQAETDLDRGEGGLGIGLAIVKGIVEMHQGTATVVSLGRGKGAEFIVSLPRAESKASAREDTAERPIPMSIPQRVLVADDNSDLAESVAMLLRLDGHDVRVAHDGPSALELAEEFEPNAALLDIGLPGLNGHELARKLRSRQNGPRYF